MTRSSPVDLAGHLASAGPVLMAGPVTRDVFDDATVPGGAVAYASRAAAALRVRTFILTGATSASDLDALAGHEVHRVECDHTLTLEHRFSGRVRHQRVIAAAGVTLQPDDVPGHWPPARTLLLGPLLPGDVDLRAFLDRSPADEIALLAQGEQRRVDEDGAVRNLDRPSDALLGAADPRVSVFLARDEIGGWPPRAIEELATRVRRVVVTHGRDGASIYRAGGVTHMPARAAERIDTTGAGDVYAAAFILAVRAGEETAAHVAAAYAAANIQRRGPAPLPTLQEIDLGTGEAGAWRGAT